MKFNGKNFLIGLGIILVGVTLLSAAGMNSLIANMALGFATGIAFPWIEVK